jgi:hypothetical protein
MEEWSELVSWFPDFAGQIEICLREGGKLLLENGNCAALSAEIVKGTVLNSYLS